MRTDVGVKYGMVMTMSRLGFLKGFSVYRIVRGLQYGQEAA